MPELNDVCERLTADTVAHGQRPQTQKTHDQQIFEDGSQEPKPITNSWTEEFLRAMGALNAAQEDTPEMPPTEVNQEQDHPLWIQDLIPLWQQHAHPGPAGATLHARVETWYTDHLRMQDCFQSRIVILEADPTTWHQTIVRAWSEVVLPQFEVDIHLVYPTTADMAQGTIAQLVLVQRPDQFQRSVIITIADTALQKGMPRSRAVVATDRVSLRSALLMTGLLYECPPEHLRHRCHLWFEGQEITGEQHHRTRHGDAFLLHVLREEDLPALAHLTYSDEQIQVGLEALLNTPRPSGVAYGPDWFNSLERAFEAGAAVEMLEEGQVAYVLTWFVDAGRGSFCQHPRVVRLNGDKRQWRPEILGRWQFELAPNCPAELHFVDPEPPKTPWENHVAHVIITQRAEPDHAAVIISAMSWEDFPGVHQNLHYISNMVSMQDVIARHAPEHCRGRTCRVRRGNLFFERDERSRIGNGDSIEIDIMPLPHQEEDHMNMLQTQVVKSRNGQLPVKISLEATIPARKEENKENQIFPDVGDCRPEDWKDENSSILIQIVHDAPDNIVDFLPQAIEISSIYSATDVEEELAAWGVSCKIFLCGGHDVVFAHFAEESTPQQWRHVYCNRDVSHSKAVLTQATTHPLSEIDHMKFLCQNGFSKAVLHLQEQWTEHLVCVHFEDATPDHEASTLGSRPRTPWPSRQPPQVDMTQPFPDLKSLPEPSKCLLEIDVTTLMTFLDDKGEWLWQDYTIFDLPDFIRTALDSCKPIQRIDRYLVYTDGSSQTRHRHKPPLWVADHDTSDSWAFAVFAEEYAEDPQQPSKIQFIGLQCQVVLYEEQASHYIGTDKIGSDAAETEGLFWAGMWRLAQNHRIPTVFLTDSSLAGDQAAGRIDIADITAPYRHLRAVYQALAAYLPGDTLRVGHVKSHAGDPYNELVDHVAKIAGSSNLCLPRQPVHMPSFKHILPHLWMTVADQPDMPTLANRGLDVTPIALPPQTLTARPAPTSKRSLSGKITLSIATGNVQTFYKGSEGHGGKLSYVCEQFTAHGLNVIGLQECRTEAGSSLFQNVLRLAGGGDNGQLGIEIWINMAQPYFHIQGKPGYFTRGDFVVVSRAPRHLLVHLLNEHIDLWLLAAHAPHSGTPSSERLQWWSDLSQIVANHVMGNNLVVMLDANAATGAENGQHIFSQDDKFSANTEAFRSFLSEHELFVPSTTDVHQGEQGTWISPVDDSLHRIDYVLLPCNWKPWCILSENLANLDFGHLGDHTATAIQLEWIEELTLPSSTQKTKGHARQMIPQAALGDALLQYRPLQWCTDIETQVDHLNQHLLHTLHEHCPPIRQGPKKSFIDDETWNIRSRKLALQRNGRRLRRQVFKELLAQCFTGWSRTSNEEDTWASWSYGNTLQVRFMSNRLQLWKTARALRNRLARAKQRAVQTAIMDLPDDCAASKILHTLKPLIGTTNPKLRKMTPLPQIVKDDGKPCANPEELRDQWIGFFGAMEGGERVELEELRNLWCKALEDFMQHDLRLQAGDIPTLTDLERAFRRVKDHKAVGDDFIPPELCHHFPVPLARLAFSQLVKLCTHGQEALLHKGGTLVAAWKRKGPQHRCESYRSLLISSHLAKSVHRAVRDHQSTVYESFLQAAQIGGRKHIPVSMGVHYIRAAARRARHHKQSHALVFLDLREAFYRVLRPIAVGGQIPDSLLAKVAARLHLPPDAIADLHALLQLPASTELAGMPKHLRRALQALHTNTHFRIHGQTDRVHTLIGSRPGDPFADVVFGYMFARILDIVEKRLTDLQIIEKFEDDSATGLYPPTDSNSKMCHTLLGPTWMDDLCLTLSHENANGVISRASTAASVLLETCTAHGATPNLDKGKSEILFTLRGAGSRRLRLRYFGAEQGRQLPILTEYGLHHISIIGHYTHLGSIAHHSGLSHREVRRRIAIGNAAFASHRKMLFQNHGFTVKRRSELFQSLVTSKIVYGMESWTFHDKKTQHYFRVAILRLYRRLLKLPNTAKLQDCEVLAATQLPAPDVMLRIARLRYLGLLYKCEQVTPWAALRADHDWMQTISEDLNWLWTLIADTCKLRDPSQHFGDWEYVLRYHRGYWKTLLQRGATLSRMKVEDDLLLRRLHYDIFNVLQDNGTLTHAPVKPHLDPEQQTQHFGCRNCAKRCRSKAGEGAHLFKVHGIVAKERQWIAGTSCEACLGEYHSHDKLQQHLRTSQNCRMVLNSRPSHRTLVPGMGSKINAELRDKHDGLLPVQRAQGPQWQQQVLRPVEEHHVPLFEDLVLAIYEVDNNDIDGLFNALQNVIARHYVGWTMTKITLEHTIAAFTEETTMDVPLTCEQIHGVLRRLGDATSWNFLQDEEHETADGTHMHSLDLYEGWCDELLTREEVWTRNETRCPRPHFRERVVLHAYSGRRRPGDLQWFIDQAVQRQQLGSVMVVSVDLVIDSMWGDISRPTTQRFWLDAIASGFVLAMLSGPPCCTWSIARGKEDGSLKAKGRHGPRVIRTRELLWGLRSLSLREMQQLHDGHILLGFSLHAMMLLAMADGLGILEHPGEPADESAASIWRLPLVQLLLRLPGFALRECAQGLFGAVSTKRTGLLTLNLAELPVHLRANMIRKELPRAATIGVDEEGRYKTAVLKEYPPALCKGMAEAFLHHFPPVDCQVDLPQLPAFFRERCQQMTCTAMGRSIGADFAR